MANRIGKYLLVALCLLPGQALAQWELDSERSTVNFISIKNDAVGEVHRFSSLLGFIGADGKVQVTIDLNSVDTLIEVRDDRMRKLLFETVKFPAARVNAQVDVAVLETAAAGGTLSAELPFTLSLHGLEQTLTAPVLVIGGGDGRLRVVSARPILLNAGDFGFEAGIAALQEIAGLKAISNAVPVTLQLVFEPAVE